MTDNQSPFTQKHDLNPSHLGQPAASEPKKPLTSPEEMVTVELPLDVLAALDQQRYQSGQTQTQIILDALRSALGLAQEPTDSERTQESTTLAADIEYLKARLSQLETVMQRIEVLEGKSIAF